MDNRLWAHRSRRSCRPQHHAGAGRGVALARCGQRGCRVNRLVTVPLTQNQFDALVDFVFNVGAENFARSTLLRELNAGNTAGAAAQFLLWKWAGGVVSPGLLRRRQAEAALFESADAPAQAA
ncbi:MAG TPA: lysozyme [Terriglobales bacterium]|nr:lysozyme [Terriglobales bacterium]